MKKHYLIILFFCCNFSTQAQEKHIQAIKAPFYVGQTVMACGTLAEVVKFEKRHFLNLDAKYPNQSLSLLIWAENYTQFEKRFGKLEQFIGRRFCARGMIKPYKNKLEITLRNPQFLRLMNR